MKFSRCALALTAALCLLASSVTGFASGGPPLAKPQPLSGMALTVVNGRAALTPIAAQGYVVDNLYALAMIGVGGSASIVVSFVGDQGRTLNIGTAESAALTVTTTAKSLPVLMAGSSLTIPAGATGVVIRIVTGSLAMNRGGTYNGAVGAGNGFAASTDAPTANSAELFTAGQLLILGAFSHSQYVTLAGVAASVLGTVTANQGTAGASAWPVSVATLPLPSNAAQETGGNLAAILAKLAGGLPAALDGSGNLMVAVQSTPVTAQLPASLDGLNLKVHEQGIVPVTGTFWQATQPISAASLPLPSGAATSAGQTTASSTLSSILTALGGGLPVALDGSGNLKVGGTFWQTTQPVSAASLPLPSGASTSASQATANTSLSSILTALNGGLPAALDGLNLKVHEQGIAAVSAASLPLPSGAATAAKQPALGTAGSASADVITVQGAVSMTALKTDGSGVTQPVSGTITANAGTGTLATSTADGSSVTLGNTTDSAVADATGTANAHLRQIAKSVSGTLTVSGTVTASGAAGDVASGSTDSGNPVKIGGKAVNAEPTALTNGQRANIITDLVGKQIILPYCNPENMVNGSLASDLTGTGSTQIIAAEGSGVRTYITTVLITNMHASVDTRVDVLDGATLIATGFAAHGGGGYTLTFVVPLRGTANTAVNIQCGTTGAQVRATVAGYKGS